MASSEKLIYLESSVISLTGEVISREKDLRKKNQQDAWKALLDYQNILFETSEKSYEEIIRTAELERRENILEYYEKLKKITLKPRAQMSSPIFGTRIHGQGIHGAGIKNYDNLYLYLVSIFDKDDADHIFYAAASNRFRFFLTIDFSTIINRYRERKEEIDTRLNGMYIVPPLELKTILDEENSI